MKVQALTLALALTLTCFSLTVCGRTEAPNASNAAMPAVQKAPSPPADIQSRIERAVVDYSSVKPALTLPGEGAYGEDRGVEGSVPPAGRGGGGASIIGST